jgi:hypothetical protein
MHPCIPFPVPGYTSCLGKSKDMPHCRLSGAECMMLGRRFMACNRRAQEVAVIGDNFMLPERPGALWSYAWRSSLS